MTALTGGMTYYFASHRLNLVGNSALQKKPVLSICTTENTIPKHDVHLPF